MCQLVIMELKAEHGYCDEERDDDYVDRVRLCLLTAATNRPIFYPSGDT
jgi:hypothetical protein